MQYIYSYVEQNFEEWQFSMDELMAEIESSESVTPEKSLIFL